MTARVDKTSPDRGLARIGALAPFTNVNFEPDLQRLKPSGVSVHVTRLGGYDLDAVPGVDQMAGLGAADLDETLSLIAGAQPDVVLYGCTSATLAHGAGFDAELARRIERQTCAKAITAAGAVVHALHALGARRIAFASPYTADLNDRAVAFLAEHAFETVGRADYAEELDSYGQGALTPKEIIAFASRADALDADALVLSCTDLRAVECVDELEAIVQKPVVTSNQAMMFETLAHLRLTGDGVRCGRLFQRLASEAAP